MGSGGSKGKQERVNTPLHLVSCVGAAQILDFLVVLMWVCPGYF